MTTFHHETSRRQILRGLALGGAAAWLHGGTLRALPAGSNRNADRGDRVLVLVHLNGGNDGLNTVVPGADPLYRRLRPTLALPENSLLPVGRSLGFHPAMSKLHQLFERDQLAVVLGVGYDHPNLSHFRSSEIWYSATSDSRQMADRGWLGRAIDTGSTCDAKAGFCGAAVRHTPFSLTSNAGAAPDLREPSQLEIPASVRSAAAEYRSWSARSGVYGDVGQLGVRAVEASRALSRLELPARPAGPGLARDLRLALALIEADVGLRYLHLSMPGFDTHDSQVQQHARLLSHVSDAVASFQAELAQRGLADRVTTLLFSEFGRRPAENSGGGTDHGTAGPVFVVGTRVQPGLHGRQPRLDKLDQGNLRHEVDFRRVYAALLRDAARVDPTSVLGDVDPLDLFSVSA